MVVRSIKKLGSSSLLSTSIRKLSSSVGGETKESTRDDGTPEKTPEQEEVVTDEREEVKGDEEVREASADREANDDVQSPTPSNQPVKENLTVSEWQSVLQSPPTEEKPAKETAVSTPKVHPNWSKHHSSLQLSANEDASVQETAVSTPKVHPNWSKHHSSLRLSANEDASAKETAASTPKVHPNWSKHHSSLRLSTNRDASAKETAASTPKVHPNWSKHHSEPVVQQSKAATEALNVEPPPEEAIDMEVSELSGTEFNYATKSVSSKESRVSKLRSMMRLSKSKSSKSSSSVKSNDIDTSNVEGLPSTSVENEVEGGEKVPSEDKLEESKTVRKVGDLKIQVVDDAGAECMQSVNQEMSLTQSTATGVSYSFGDDGRSAEEHSSFKCSAIFSELSNMCHRVEIWTDLTLTQLSEGLCNKSESEKVAADEITVEAKDEVIEHGTSEDPKEGCVSEETKSQVANAAELGAAQCKTSALELGDMCQQWGASSIGWMSQVGLRLCNKNEVEKTTDDETPDVVKEEGDVSAKEGEISEGDNSGGATAAGLLGSSILAIGCMSLCNKSEAEKVVSDEIPTAVIEKENSKVQESSTPEGGISEERSIAKSEAVQSVANDVVSALEAALEGGSVKLDTSTEEAKSTSRDALDKEEKSVSGNTQASVKSMAESIFNALKGTSEAVSAEVDTNHSFESVLSAKTEPRGVSVDELEIQSRTVRSPSQLAAVTEGSDGDSCKASEAGGNALEAALGESNGNANVKEATSIEDKTSSDISKGKVACGIAACAGIAACGAMANTKSIEEESDSAQAVHGEESAGNTENGKDDADLVHENQDVSQAPTKQDKSGKETIGKALLDSILYKLAKAEVVAKTDGNTDKQVKIHLLRSKLLHLTHREDKWADQLNGESSVPDDVFIQGPLEKLVSPALAMIDRAMLAGDTGCMIGTADIIDHQCVDHHNVNSSASDGDSAVFTA
eukprot:scaffold70281_cov67-Cyclotella_meneghiniana.AAC.9